MEDPLNLNGWEMSDEEKEVGTFCVTLVYTLLLGRTCPLTTLFHVISVYKTYPPPPHTHTHAPTPMFVCVCVVGMHASLCILQYTETLNWASIPPGFCFHHNISSYRELGCLLILERY